MNLYKTNIDIVIVAEDKEQARQVISLIAQNSEISSLDGKIEVKHIREQEDIPEQWRNCCPVFFNAFTKKIETSTTPTEQYLDFRQTKIDEINVSLEKLRKEQAGIEKHMQELIKAREAWY